jgi:hypothetical protein
VRISAEPVSVTAMTICAIHVRMLLDRFHANAWTRAIGVITDSCREDHLGIPKEL